ncbi:hypothetical protein FPCIR_3118 [Fusarium pseudocircinatum]|uniref:Uncharacterized protein n=1 Tax=Fusarium pseudocircinatum TaxID=56676 RepID=A0A8H5PKC5_9HYPO|nr:hypothetical protein FPCIR_3118 [Fusarium pseudocircinatum]
MFPAIEDILNDGYWNFRGRMSRSQLNGGGLGLVDCSESMVEDQLADEEGEGSHAQSHSRSPPSLRRSSRLKGRRVDDTEVSDSDIDLQAKSSSHEDEDDFYSDGEQEYDWTVLFAAVNQVAQLQTLVYYSKDARNDEGQEIVYFHPLPQENHAKYAERGDDLDRGSEDGWGRPKHRRCKTEDEADVEDNKSSEHGGKGAEKDDDSES